MLTLKRPHRAYTFRWRGGQLIQRPQCEDEPMPLDSGSTRAVALAPGNAGNETGRQDLYIDAKNRPALLRDQELTKHLDIQATFDNDMFRKCSREWHELQHFVALHQDQDYRNALVHIEALQNTADQCVPQESVALPEYYTRRATCIECLTKTHIKHSMPRVLALLAAPVEETWKAVVGSQASDKGQLIFPPSHVCNFYREDNASTVLSHFLLETGEESSYRKDHHGGRYGCFCDPPCIGRHVTRTFTKKDLIQQPTEIRRDRSQDISRQYQNSSPRLHQSPSYEPPPKIANPIKQNPIPSAQSHLQWIRQELARSAVILSSPMPQRLTDPIQQDARPSADSSLHATPQGFADSVEQEPTTSAQISSYSVQEDPLALIPSHQTKQQ